MRGQVLISPSELSDLIKSEPVVLIDTRDPAIYAETSRMPSMCGRSLPTSQAQHPRV